MAESYVQLPVDSTGKKLRTREETVGANTVQTQFIAPGALPTYSTWANNVAFANNKQMISIFNGVGSAKIIKLKKIFLINLTTSAISGVGVRFDFMKTTAQSVGTAITPEKMDTNDANVPAQILIATGATVTEGNMLFAHATNNDEVGVTGGFPTAAIQALINMVAEGNEVKEIVLREGQGLTIKNVVNTTLGLYGFLIVFCLE